MTQSVTGIFSDRAGAERATLDLVAAGFRRDHVAILDASNLAPRSWIAVRIADCKRAVWLGTLVGAAGGGLLGASLATAHPAATMLGAALLLGGGGALLGTLVGRSTESQLQTELENEVTAGRVLVSVTTDAAHAGLLGTILARTGRPAVVTTSTRFVAAALPGSHR